jgi:LacI family transcriptional regulator
VNRFRQRTPSTESAGEPRVALFVESSRAYGRGLLTGIVRYVRETRPWSISYQECRLGEFSPAWLKRWSGDGIIARVADLRMANAIARTRRPAVDVFGQVRHAQLAAVYPDDGQVARLAAEHFLESGFQHLAYCGYAGTRYSDCRCAAFVRLADDARRDCAVYSAPPSDVRSMGAVAPQAFSWEQHGHNDEKDLRRWLTALPKPVAIMACNSIRGQQLLTACRQLGIEVPEEAAVIGVDSDEIICELSDPPLSSVILNAAQAGYEAAALLDRMMSGQATPQQPILVAPVGIARRRSTDVVAVEDRQVAMALRYIRDHACGEISIADLLKVVHLSRAALHRRFHNALGRSPKAEILRVRLEQSRRLLTETDLTLAEVARRVGFASPEHFCYLFKSKLGQTPGQCRVQARVSTSNRVGRTKGRRRISRDKDVSK